jgi:hypothetical protein
MRPLARSRLAEVGQNTRRLLADHKRMEPVEVGMA